MGSYCSIKSRAGVAKLSENPFIITDLPVANLFTYDRNGRVIAINPGWWSTYEVNESSTNYSDQA